MSINRTLVVIDAFIAAPRTAAELQDACRLSHYSAWRYITMLRRMNRITFAGYAEKGAETRGAAATVWRWVPPEQENTR